MKFLTYENGQWKVVSPTNIEPLRAYFIKNLDTKAITIPIVYDIPSDHSIELTEGWNLISVIDGDITNNNATADVIEASKTSLESLAVTNGERYYAFAWIFDANTRTLVASGRTYEEVNGTVKDYTAYWVYMLTPRTYTAPTAPGG